MKIWKLRTFVRSLATAIKSIDANVRSLAGSDVISNVIRMSHKESSKFIYENCRTAVLFYSREELWSHIVENIEGSEGLHLEFGVADGYSLSTYAPIKTATKFFGFDSFEGLPESWHGTNGYLKGAFNRNGELPEVPANVELIKGWFSDTLPNFLKYNDGPVKFLHLDADIYSSTKTVLDLLGERLSVGSIVIFDEYHGYPGWENGEKLAWEEFVSTSGIEFKFIAFSQMQAAIEITRV
jgi:hypothetical protein